MSNNNNYTDMKNTGLSASAVIGSMTGDNIKAILFQMATSQDDVLLLTGTPATVDLSVARMVQAAISSVIIRKTVDAAATLSLGADTAEVASRYVRLFNLDSTDKKVLLTFRADGNAATVNVVNLATVGATHANINIFLGGGSVAGTQELYPNASAAGLVKVVEVYASNLTAGSEVVNFNILTV
jgi:hypothetical protein